WGGGAPLPCRRSGLTQGGGVPPHAPPPRRTHRHRRGSFARRRESRRAARPRPERLPNVCRGKPPAASEYSTAGWLEGPDRPRSFFVLLLALCSCLHCVLRFRDLCSPTGRK